MGVILLSVLFIVVGVLTIVFPRSSSFFYIYNFTTKKVENKDEPNSESSLMMRRVQGIIFVLLGLFFLLGSCAKRISANGY